MTYIEFTNHLFYELWFEWPETINRRFLSTKINTQVKISFVLALKNISFVGIFFMYITTFEIKSEIKECFESKNTKLAIEHNLGHATHYFRNKNIFNL